MNKSKSLEEWGKLITVCILFVLVFFWGLKLTGALSLSIPKTGLISLALIACIGLIPALVWLSMGAAQAISNAPKKFFSILMIAWALPVALLWLLELLNIVSLSSFWFWILTFYPFSLLLLACFIFGIVFIVINLTSFKRA